ncbi:MazG nucleotide pyrophosphohydrolase domain-containing protein [Deinococcus sonorensis KR-87]|uniref:MazG nucleotide pyrophosphohydrolase domain-containing protein n=1 Tax=Deinococcus sonorensis KR-87 TaxID=694439 RepID=A0AAU7UEA2_9DEIO
MNGKTPKPGEDVGDLELELADLLFVMMCMANEQGLSLERGFERMMQKVETRDAGALDQEGTRAFLSGSACHAPPRQTALSWGTLSELAGHVRAEPGRTLAS